MASNALLWGLLSAVSLPLGAVAGIVWRPGSRWVSAMMAFGAGALLFALSIELMADIPEFVASHGNAALFAAAGGALAGGLIFDLLNQLLNNRGAFLRNLSNARRYVASRKRRRASRMLRGLMRSEPFRRLRAEQLAGLVRNVRRREFAAGTKIYTGGDSANFIYYIRRGEVIVEAPGEAARTIRPGATFGAGDVVLNRPREAEALAGTDTTLYLLSDEDVQEAMARDESMGRAVTAIATRDRDGTSGSDEEEAVEELDEDLMPVFEQDIQDESTAAARTATVAMAIWLGIAIDAVPESLVIGTLAIGPEGMSLAFIAGVFLANFPEAMSSSITMREHGMSIVRILWMWGSICLLTGAGALFGALLLPAEPLGNMFFVVLAIEGVAAGAMLTAIAQSMLPEAFEQGGSIVGIMTLLGFLAALTVAVL